MLGMLNAPPESMKELVEIVFDVSMLAFVAGSMITLGLGLTVSQIIA